MGYDLTIRRDGEIPITLAEWQSVVRSDPSLRFTVLNEDASYIGGEDGTPLLAEWRAQGIPAGEMYWTEAGWISAKYPEPPLIAKMIEIAGRLGARVVGDDGEFYRSDGTPEQS